ncbi:EamA family transporter [Moraxella nasibovis]|uniref:DMT family transporter n=1 Tax=Moraxella nasibovis TaxID=2904120 RepID=UPI00240F71D6|nr:EamA family transporter [Moraxella nasibovis]WFF39104.1 EamA family transporter [Moraxella nasibovis]
MTKNNNILIGSLQVILAGVCWGSLGIFSSKLLAFGFESFQVTILRIVTAGLVVLLLLPAVLPILKKLSTPEWINLILQSLIGVLGMTLCYFYAVGQVGVSMAVALLYTAPVFSLVLARLILNEPITKKSAILGVVAVVGVGFLMAGKVVFNMGVIVGLLSGLCYSLYGILGKKAMAYHHPSNLVFFSSVFISAITLLLLPQTYGTYGQLLNLPSYAMLFVLGLSVVGTIAPFFLYMSALHKLPATTASVFTIIEPLTAIILAVILLKQPLSLWQMIGVGLIVGATLVNALER